METKIGLATLLSKFKFEKSDSTKVPLEFNKKMVVLTPAAALNIKTERL